MLRMRSRPYIPSEHLGDACFPNVRGEVLCSVASYRTIFPYPLMNNHSEREIASSLVVKHTTPCNGTTASETNHRVHVPCGPQTAKIKLANLHTRILASTSPFPARYVPSPHLLGVSSMRTSDLLFHALGLLLLLCSFLCSV